MMHLVDDEHLVAIARRRKREPGDDDLANVVDAGVTRRIDLEHIEVAPLRNLDARVADAARIGRWSFFAVERACQDARGRRLSASTRTGEDKRMRNAFARNRVAERTRHHLLPDDIVEALRAVFARKDLIGHGE